MIYVEVHGSSSLKSWSHVILATSTVTLCAFGAGICTNINNALVRSSRAFTITSMGLYRGPVFHPVLFYHAAPRRVLRQSHGGGKRRGCAIHSYYRWAAPTE